MRRVRASRTGVTVLTLLAASAAAGCGSSDNNGPGFSIDPPTASVLVGGTVQLTAVNPPGKVAWSSTNSSVASVQPQTGFVTGVSSGSATISALSGGKVATAQITVTAPPSIALSAPTATFQAPQGGPDPAPDTVAVTNAGNGTLSLRIDSVAYGAAQPTGWLSAALAGGTTPTKLVLHAATGSLNGGTYTATVFIASDDAENSPQSVVVTFHVVAPPSIALAPNSFQLIATIDTTVDTTVAVTNGGGFSLTGLHEEVDYAAGQRTGWMSATLSGDSAPATLSLHIDTHVVPIGNYSAAVHVTSTVNGVQPAYVQVALTVTPGPAIALSSTQVQLKTSIGKSPADSAIAVTNGGGGSLIGLALSSVTYTQGQGGWLTATLAGDSAPTSLTLHVASNALPLGDYQAVLSVTSPVAGNSPLQLTVNLNVGPPPVIAYSPSGVVFSGFIGGTVPGPQAISITNSGGGVIPGLSATVRYSGSNTGWLATPAWQDGNTTAPAILLLQPGSINLPLGTDTAYVDITSSDTSIAKVTVQVIYKVQSFTVTIFPLFNTAFGAGYPNSPCSQSGCHTSTSSVQGAYSFASSFVTPGDPNTGGLICKITNGATAGGSCSISFPMIMPAADIALIRAWIAAGAPQ
jgi:Bacterial Ig-like domain (group 2)